MNLQSRINKTVRVFKRAAEMPMLSGDACHRAPFSPIRMIVKSVRIKFVFAVALAMIAPAFVVTAQTNYYTYNGGEFAVVGSLPGDQVFPDVALSTNGGFVVWQDNATDGDGWGLSATRVDANLTPVLTWQDQRVNVQGAGNQENAHVAMLKNGGAVFVWQGGPQSLQHIWARYLTSANTWLTTTDLLVGTFTNNFQADPSVAVLTNGNVVVVWSSYNQAGASTLLDVYAKILSPTGATVLPEFLVNQNNTTLNQRTPSVAALAGGGFAVTWISEAVTNLSNGSAGTNSAAQLLLATTTPAVHVFTKTYNGNGVPQTGEVLVDTGHGPCANPAVAGATDGSFVIAWSGWDLLNYTNGWDVYARKFTGNGSGGTVSLINSYVLGNQYAPRLVAIGLDYMVVWTSLGQDGSREGVYGRFIHDPGTPTSDEFRVNTTTVSQQMHPVVAADGLGQFLAVWTSFAGSPYSFDLYAQRYVNVDGVLLPMPAPFVYAPFTLSNNVYQPQLEVSWSPLLGISVSNYQVYVDGAATNMAATTSNVWVMTAANGLTTNSTHSFQVSYMRTDGRVSPLSPSASGTTWSGQSWGGIPFEWMTAYYGPLVVSFGPNGPVYNWPSPNSTMASGGMTLLDLFLSGGEPTDPSTWLKTTLTKTSQGFFVGWNTQPGFTYQVQNSTNLVSWQNLGSPRFAAGATDSIFVGAGPAGYYRVYLLR